MSELTINFPNDELREAFLTWLSDAGGEQNFFLLVEQEDLLSDPADFLRFDYSKCFLSWGYKPEVDGNPTIRVHIERERGL